MAVFKIEKNKNYTVMSNYHLRDKRMSLKAKGLLSFMLSLPLDWDYSLDGLEKICKEGKDSIRSALNELKLYGYLVIKKIQNEKGIFEYEYMIYEYPYSENPDMDYPYLENPTQINTNIQNTKKQNDKEDREDKPKSSFFDAGKHNRLTLELIDRKYINQDDIQLYFYDNLFDELLKENSYVDLIMVLHYILARVKWNKYKDEYGNDIENKYGYLKESIYNNLEIINAEPIELW